MGFAFLGDRVRKFVELARSTRGRPKAAIPTWVVTLQGRYDRIALRFVTFLQLGDYAEILQRRRVALDIAAGGQLA